MLALADELVRRPVNVLAAGGVPAAAAAKAATTTIPIAFFVAGDPVRLGLITSMNRPDGNLTGVTSLGAELSAKRMELASELVPKGAGVALPVNPDNAYTAIIIKDAQTAAGSLGLQLSVLRATSAGDIDANFAMLAQQRAAALVVGNDGLFMRKTTGMFEVAVLAASAAAVGIVRMRATWRRTRFGTGAFLNSHRERLVALAAHHGFSTPHLR